MLYLERLATNFSLLLSPEVHYHVHRSRSMDTIWAPRIKSTYPHFISLRLIVVLSSGRLREGNDKCLDYWDRKIQMEEGPLGRPESRWEDEYIISNVDVCLIQQVNDGIERGASVNAMLNFRVL
jgi:hypothetical protein